MRIKTRRRYYFHTIVNSTKFYGWFELNPRIIRLEKDRPQRIWIKGFAIRKGEVTFMEKGTIIKRNPYSLKSIKIHKITSKQYNNAYILYGPKRKKEPLKGEEIPNSGPQNPQS